MSTNPKLLEVWKKCAKLNAEADKLYDESNKLIAECIKLNTEGEQLRAQGDKLYAEAHLLWINAIIEVYGKDTTMEWNYRKDVNGSDCILGNGEVYTVEMGRE